MRTISGFLLESQMFSLKLISASQQGGLSNFLEYQTDWKEAMQILLNSLETFPTNKAEVQKMGSKKLEEWALTQEGGNELELKIGVTITEKKYYQTDSLKSLRLDFKRLDFNNMFKTVMVVMFNVKRKKVMKSLKVIAAEAVSSRLSSAEVIDRLEIPRGLLEDVDAAYKDSWRVRYVDTSHKKRKIAQVTSLNLASSRDCPFCWRANFKRLISHIIRNTECHIKYKVQMEYDFVKNNCFW